MKLNGKEAARAQADRVGARASAGPFAPAVARMRRGPCENVLARVIAQARALSHDRREAPPGDGARPGGDAERHEETDADARARLTATLRDSDAETAEKLERLMIAGRDGRSVAAVQRNASPSDAHAAFATIATECGRSDLVEYLLRGHAMACATGINLERPIDDWQSHSADTLDERAWLSFGKQLAQSVPADWQCLAIIESGTGGLNKLYLKLEDHAWWSFQALLDRPTQREVENERRSLGRRQFKGISASTLEAVLGQLEQVQGRALQRAARAIRARVGERGPPRVEPSTKSNATRSS
jgi:hypothetical protein